MSAIRSDFPILTREHDGRPLVYLDSAATTQKPTAVIQSISDYYESYNSNVHRAAHVLAEEATSALEAARSNVAKFINASRPAEICFTKGTTESINLLANIFSDGLDIGPDDEILITALEHHSNIVPWQMLAARTHAKLLAVDVLPNGDIDQADFARKLSPRTKVFACNHVSNALGTVNPIAQMIEDAHAVNAIVVIDGAQGVLHKEVDVQALDCDFYAFSGHKMYAPTGIGVLYGKYDLLDSLPPWQGGGEMIERVTLEHTTFQQPPFKYEAGTPNIAGVIGLGAAVEYLQSIDRMALVAEEQALVNVAMNRLQQVPGVQLVGTPAERSAVISFNIAGAHPQDVGTLLDQQGVAVRAGHHCAMPLMDQLGIPGTIRASFSLYSNEDDVNRLIEAVDKASTFV